GLGMAMILPVDVPLRSRAGPSGARYQRERSRHDAEQRCFAHDVGSGSARGFYLNRAWAVLPLGAVICTAPFGCAGSVPAENFPDSWVAPAGSSTIRWLLPPTTRMATPLKPACDTGLSSASVR